MIKLTSVKKTELIKVLIELLLYAIGKQLTNTIKQNSFSIFLI